ncbi:MAG: hypothetical protein QX199_16775, partial [Methylococcaceae bacterium]
YLQNVEKHCDTTQHGYDQYLESTRLAFGLLQETTGEKDGFTQEWVNDHLHRPFPDYGSERATYVNILNDGVELLSETGRFNEAVEIVHKLKHGGPLRETRDTFILAKCMLEEGDSRGTDLVQAWMDQEGEGMDVVKKMSAIQPLMVRDVVMLDSRLLPMLRQLTEVATGYDKTNYTEVLLEAEARWGDTQAVFRDVLDAEIEPIQKAKYLARVACSVHARGEDPQPVFAHIQELLKEEVGYAAHTALLRVIEAAYTTRTDPTPFLDLDFSVLEFEQAGTNDGDGEGEVPVIEAVIELGRRADATQVERFLTLIPEGSSDYEYAMGTAIESSLELRPQNNQHLTFALALFNRLAQRRSSKGPQELLRNTALALTTAFIDRGDLAQAEKFSSFIKPDDLLANFWVMKTTLEAEYRKQQENAA